MCISVENTGKAMGKEAKIYWENVGYKEKCQVVTLPNGVSSRQLVLLG